MRVACVLPGILCASLAAPSFARAEPAHAPPIGFAEAVGLADRTPALVGAERAAALDRSALEHVTRGWSPLVLRVLPEVALGGGATQPGLRLELEQAIPLTDRRGRARAVVRATAARRVAEARARSLDTRIAIARAWIDSWSAAAVLAHARASLALARRFVEITTRAHAARVVTTVELADARALEAEAAIALLDAEGALVDTSFALAEALGEDRPRSADAHLPAVEVPAKLDEHALASQLASLPSVQARQLAADVARAQAAEAPAARSSQLLLGTEITVAPEGDRRAAGVLGIQWSHDRGERERRQALAEAALIDGEVELAVRRARISFERMLHEVEHSGELLAEIERSLLTAVEASARGHRRAFELGESTVLEVLAAERVALVAGRKAIEARAAHAWARVHLRLWLDGMAPR